MSLHTETSMFSQDSLETGRALVDCGATRCIGSWKELNGLARMIEQLYGSLRFSLDRTRKTWYLCKWRETKSEREGAFQVNVGGKMCDCKIAYLNATGVPFLLSVHGLQHWCHILSESDRPGLCPTRTRGKWTSLLVTGEGYALSNSL